MQWEYKAIRVEKRKFWTTHIDLEDLSIKLNKQGEQGWELVNVVRDGHLYGVLIATLKRPCES